MKKIFSALLCFVMLFTLAACSSELDGPASAGNTTTDGAMTATGEETNAVFNTEGFCTGYARTDITPKAPVPLAGFGNTLERFSTKVLDPLYATAVAVSNNDVTALFITVDLIRVTKLLTTQTASLIQAETGVDPDYIFFCATHTHSGPDVSNTDPSIAVWKKIFYENVTKAAKEAVANLDRTEVYLGETKTEGLNFVRRYLLADGTYAFLNGIGSGAATVGHETDADTEMQIIKFDRENQKDILMVNWQCHPTQSGGSEKTDISADFIGAFRKKAENDTDCHFAYYEGACGNVVAMSRIKEEMKSLNYTSLGEQLADTLTAALGNLEKTEGGEIKAARKTIVADINHLHDADVEAAKKTMAETGMTLNETLQAQLDISEIMANHLVIKSNLGATAEIDIATLSIGDIAFIAAPYEMFDTNGMEIKSGSPFKMTFICEQSNDAVGYIPSAFAFPHGMYEVFCTHFVPGTGEKLVEEFLSLLNSLK